MGATQVLAEFIAGTGYDALPFDAVLAARRAIIDTLGVTLAGSREASAKIITSFVRDLGGNPRSTVVAGGFKTSPPDAALANGTMAHALDYDDVFYIGPAHPTTAILPAILALAEDLKASGKDVIEALVLGFEVWYRFSISGMNPRALGFHPTAILGTIGAAAASAKLLRLDSEKTGMVLGLAASHACGMGRNRGTMTKPFHAGNAARSGVISAMLVREGFTAASGLMEGRFGFCDAFSGGSQWDEAKLMAQLGHFYGIVSPGVAVKKYPTCQLTHRAIDAMLALVKANDIMPYDVAAIECKTGAMAADVLVFDKPVDYLQGKFSMQFCLAAALVYRRLGLNEVTNEKVNDALIKELMQKVRLESEGEPTGEEDIVVIILKDGRRYTQGVAIARGDRGVSLTDDEIISKYRDCAGGILPVDATERALKLMLGLEHLRHINDLMQLI